MSRRVLILGGTGFMGRWLAASLRTLGDEVMAPQRSEADVGDAASLRAIVRANQPEIVINLAGLSSVTHEDAEALYDTNTLGHLRLLQAVSAHAPSARVFLASTANVYGQGERGAAFHESDPPAPRNHYAVSKLAAEHLHYVFSGLTTCAARPFNCIGRGQKPAFVVAKLVNAYRRRQPEIELGDVGVRRDFVDIRDACAMWRALLDAPTPPPRVNFGNGVAVAVADVIATLERVSGHRACIASSSQLARPADLTYQRADTRIVAGLGYTRAHSIEDTLAWMLAEEAGPDEA